MLVFLVTIWRRGKPPLTFEAMAVDLAVARRQHADLAGPGGHVRVVERDRKPGLPFRPLAGWGAA